MDVIGEYDELPFTRQMNAEYVELSQSKFFMTGYTEFNVTKARKIIKNYKERTGEKISFTAWVIHCVAKAVAKHKRVQAMLKGNKVIIFDDVDVVTPVEQIIEGRRTPTLLVLRKANEKSVRELHDEIRERQENPKLTSTVERKKLKLLFKLPKFIRKLILWRRIKNNPFMLKKLNGTIQVIAVGMFGKGKTYWGTNLGFHPLHVVIGGIVKKPRLVKGELKNIEFLQLTIKIDHIITDGGPATRFGKTLSEYIENAEGLAEFEK